MGKLIGRVSYRQDLWKIAFAGFHIRFDCQVCQAFVKLLPFSYEKLESSSSAYLEKAN